MIPRGYFAVLYPLPGDEGVGVKFVEHPNVITWGRDWTHAEEMAREALSLSLETEFSRGFRLPRATKPQAKRGERVVFVPLEPEVRVAYQLREYREKSGLTQRELAQRMGIAYQSYQRMERPGHANLSLATLARVAKVLKREVVIELR